PARLGSLAVAALRLADQAAVGERNHTGILAVEHHVPVVLAAIVELQSGVQMPAALADVAAPEACDPARMVGFEHQLAVAALAGQRHELLLHLERLVVAAAHAPEGPQAPQDREQLRPVAESATALACTREDLLHLQRR